MKHNSLIHILILTALMLTGACSSNVRDELPEKISSFVAEYFPNRGIKSYTVTDSEERVQLNGGITIVFDNNREWTTADPGGNALPEAFLYDCIPPALLQYLENKSTTGNVYKAERTSRDYILTLNDTYITYNIETGEINCPRADG